MRIVSFMHEGETHVGYVVGDVVHDGGRRPDRIIPADPVCAAGKEIRATGLQLPLHEVSLLAPIPWPSKVIGVGLNYAEHAHETGAAHPPTEPMIFPIIPSTVAAHRAAVQVPPESYSDSLDYEAELAVVIGREAKAVPNARALDYVFGYACANDISSRKPQWQGNWVFARAAMAFSRSAPG
jgi:2-keto-4-pentenoate hydratase/2-oxohepta-3-ene-1,7-dioic acid hydratase in catechol pathway